jgi:hypothetical protein
LVSALRGLVLFPDTPLAQDAKDMIVGQFDDAEDRFAGDSGLARRHKAQCAERDDDGNDTTDTVSLIRTPRRVVVLGAKLGASGQTFLATSGHNQPPSTQFNRFISIFRRHTAIVRPCLLSSGSRVRILPGAPDRRPCGCSNASRWEPNEVFSSGYGSVRAVIDADSADRSQRASPGDPRVRSRAGAGVRVASRPVWRGYQDAELGLDFRSLSRKRAAPPDEHGEIDMLPQPTDAAGRVFTMVLPTDRPFRRSSKAAPAFSRPSTTQIP